MIKEFEYFHGLIFTKILHYSQNSVVFKTYPTPSNSSYILNDKIGIYIKYSAKRLTPWNFSFLKEHQDEIYKMKSELGHVFLVLVCNDDGVVCLSYDELKQILDGEHAPIEWISASRKPREMYSVAGSNGKLSFKIGDNEFPKKLFLAI